MAPFRVRLRFCTDSGRENKIFAYKCYGRILLLILHGAVAILPHAEC